MILLVAPIIALFNILTNHTMLTRKRSIFYCVMAYIVNSFIFIMISVYLISFPIDSVISKYLFYLTAFSYIGYISIVFSEPFPIKLFSMFSIWVFSTINSIITRLIFDLVGTYSMNSYLIFIAIIIPPLLLLLFSYHWYGNYFKIILRKIHVSVVHLMSAYMLIALLLLINSFSLNNQLLTITLSNIDMLLLIIFILLGYFIVFFGISSSSKNALLQQNMDTLKKQSAIYYELANYDALTGIANRQNILSQISETSNDFKNTNEKFALLMFDIDKFKSINDQYGHAIGDKALKFVVNRVNHCLKEDDFIGRLGGDEFIIFAKNIQTKAAINALIKRIINTLETPFEIDEVLLSIDISIGISLFPTDSQIMDKLLDQADQAMYQAKKRVGTTYEFFNNS